MATIQPHLIHLLNESTTPQLPHTELPPIRLPLSKTSERTLPPLESDGKHRSDRVGADGLTNPNNVPPIYGYFTADECPLELRKDGGRTEGKYAGSTAAMPLRLLLDGPGATEHSPNNPTDDTLDPFDDASNKKRNHALHVKDDFMQLPQPLKKLKAAQQAPVMPPIINGLHAPPPHAAMFPPISSDVFDNNDGTQVRLLHDFNHVPEEKPAPQLSPEADKNANKARKRAAKPRRKWSEEETNHLLLGVSRYGVGKWTSILEDSEYKFNERTAGDLKDRFRTCCPDELRQSSKTTQDPPDSAPRQPKQKTKTETHLEKILIESEEPPVKEKSADAPDEAESNPKPRKSRAHRKKMQDLAELGIFTPFKRSHRRERRPFTDQEDREILEGLERYGPAWTKIQRDPRFNLCNRQPTDLRDRVRNKYSDIYHRIEKGTFQIKEAGRGNDIMEPSINMSIENSLQPPKVSTHESQINHIASREDLPRWPLQMRETTENSHTGSTFDFGEVAAPQITGGEMDIARLLLDDTELPQTYTRHGGEIASESSSPATAALEPHRDRIESRAKTTERAQRPGR
ncbi:Fc.00g041010.m01.CDS01 [Cosmosporella sp. VM-42]